MSGAGSERRRESEFCGERGFWSNRQRVGGANVVNGTGKGRVLFVATVADHITAFHLPYLKWFRERGYETYAATSGDADIPYCDKAVRIDIRRSPFSLANLRAYGQLKSLLKRHHFDLIHCHTPMGGVLARLAARKYRKKGTVVLYTAHGFHFYKGGPLSGWAIYYPIEKYLSRFTDGLITINSEDYAIAKSRFHAKKAFLSSGVGYDNKRFFPRNEADKSRYRREFGYAHDDILLICVAELSKGKNQRFLIDVLKRIRLSRVRLLLVGADRMNGAHQRYAREIGVADKVDFFGYRSDIDALVPMCDIAAASSKREGLPVNVMEAMACGLPVVATDIRGHRDLIATGENGYLERADDIAAFLQTMRALIASPALRKKIGNAAAASIKPYSVSDAMGEIVEIYESFI
jgi:glycosyltransferase EpsD